MNQEQIGSDGANVSNSVEASQEVRHCALHSNPVEEAELVAEQYQARLESEKEG